MPVHEFTYLHPDRYNGTTGNQRGPFAQAYWERNDPWEQEGGEGESFAALLMRVQETLSRLYEMSAEFTAVFSHGLFLRAMLWSALTGIHSATPENMRRYHNFVRGVWMPNGAILETLVGRNGREHGRMFFSGFHTSHTDQHEQTD
ncbi:MAG: histidine phosphatase family protein [Anaerolineae bacterium]|nr:histidine phosphatase family protein [Anaerolineae bacterium]